MCCVQTQIREDMIRVVDLGPFKHKVCFTRRGRQEGRVSGGAGVASKSCANQGIRKKAGSEEGKAGEKQELGDSQWSGVPATIL